MNASASRWEAVIGLEVHAQLSTRTKIFCACPTQFGSRANSQTCPVCLGLPGVLPVLNRQVVDCALRLGLACGSRIAPASVFARKNYFYPDLPKNYQISQYDKPLCEGGQVEMMVDGHPRTARLVRIHLEEDAGKSMHDQTGGTTSLVDLNRCGVPLAEIVGEPDLRHPEEAGAYLTALRQLVRYLGICDGNMEEGSLRCDANVSVRPTGASTFGTRVEIKNMNSIRGVVAALEHEIRRQGKLLDEGGTVNQETRTWDPDRGVTVFMRSKEHAHDYRYFPDPDLVPLHVDEAWLARVRTQLPELPMARLQRFTAQYALPVYDAVLLTESRELADYYEDLARTLGDAKQASNWMMAEVLRLLNERGESIGRFSVRPPAVAALLHLVKDGAISGKIAKEVFDEMVATGAPAEAIVARRGLRQISDEPSLTAAVDKILDAHPGQVKAYLGGKEGLAGFFVGQLMQATAGQANPKLANQLVRAALERRRSPA
jgi:aspartyl-tRNA(Asn)/glutamyl-tRNA(Gln) amidotransferase subunit B